MVVCIGLAHEPTPLGGDDWQGVEWIREMISGTKLLGSPVGPPSGEVRKTSRVVKCDEEGVYCGRRATAAPKYDGKDHASAMLAKPKSECVI